MDIRNWPLGRIMQLPDHCFGRRFLVSVTANIVGVGTTWTISDLALPEICVIWEFTTAAELPSGAGLNCRLALGDVLPTTAAEMSELEPLFPGFGIVGAEPKVFKGIRQQQIFVRSLKLSIAAGGRRIIIEMINTSAIEETLHLLFVVSSIPNEVPDCLF